MPIAASCKATWRPMAPTPITVATDPHLSAAELVHELAPEMDGNGNRRRRHWSPSRLTAGGDWHSAIATGGF